MAAKKKPKSSKKSKTVSKVSLSKLSNKRLGRLARQGKLKGHFKTSQYLQLLKKRTRGPVDPETAHEERVEERREQQTDIPLVEADYEYFATPDRDFSFITDVSDGEEEGKKKRRKNRKDEEEEDDLESKYEQTNRRNNNGKEMRSLLPIKTKQGIIPQALEVEAEEESDDDSGSGKEEKKEAEEDVVLPKKDLPPLSTAQIFQQRQKKLREKKMKVSTLATTVVENPEGSTRSLRELREMLNEDDPDIFITVKKIVIVSLAEVFKDIIPDYHIRDLTAKEKAQATKKDTKQVRDFEDSLLNNYKHYLEFLEIIVKGKPPKGHIHRKKRKKYMGAVVPQEAVMPMRLLALRCLGDLLSTHPHFNYRTNIIATIIPYMNSKSQEISEVVCGTVKKIFREDKSGEVTLEIVRLIGRVAKGRHYSVQPQMLATFLSLKIKEVDRSQQENKMDRRAKMSQMSRRELKRKKQMESLQKELREAAAENNKEKKLRLHTEVVNMIFLTYFRVLKVGHTSNLLSVVLEGLAKFAHLINVEFFDDLFAVLNELVDSGELTYRESLHCVQTAFTILSGQGSALNIDPMRFYRHLYISIFRLHAGITGEDVPIALDCLHVMVNKRKRQVSQQRLLAFIKRLTMLALQLWSNGSLAILAMVRSFLHVDQKTDLLYDRDFVGSGVYLPELDEPEHCNAANTSLYELHLLRHHYHPTVQKYANHLIARAPSQGPGQLPLELRKSPPDLYFTYDPSEMTFMPPITSKPKVKKKYFYNHEFVQDEVAALVNAALGLENGDSQKSSTDSSQSMNGQGPPEQNGLKRKAANVAAFKSKKKKRS